MTITLYKTNGCVLFNSTKRTVKEAVLEAHLSGADLSRADLRWADLRGADLRRASLSGANLSGADLYGADLYGADLSGADLRRASLSKVNLRWADLRGADLRWADLSGANLSGADLYGADLRRASLSEALNIPEHTLATTSILPEGDLIGWKKCEGGVIVKLRIPSSARRSNATGRKCRAEFVEVLEVFGGSVGTSTHDSKTTYRVGETVRCDVWNPDRWNECAGGIHFFITRYEAEQY
jgi:hypothetical protein